MNYLVNDAKELGGTTSRQEDSKFIVSAWYIPGGYEYDRAEVIDLYFSEEEGASKFEEKYREIPEMACKLDLSDERVIALLKKQEETNTGTTRGMW